MMFPWEACCNEVLEHNESTKRNGGLKKELCRSLWLHHAATVLAITLLFERLLDEPPRPSKASPERSGWELWSEADGERPKRSMRRNELIG